MDAKKNRGEQKIWEGFPEEVETSASFPLPHQIIGFCTKIKSALQPPEATPSSKQYPSGSWPHSTDFLLKSGAHKVANRWRFCLHKIDERQGTFLDPDYGCEWVQEYLN